MLFTDKPFALLYYHEVALWQIKAVLTCSSIYLGSALYNKREIIQFRDCISLRLLLRHGYLHREEMYCSYVLYVGYFFCCPCEICRPKLPRARIPSKKIRLVKVNTKSKQWVPDICKKCLPADLCSQMWGTVKVSSNLCWYEVRCTKSLLETSVADFYMHQPFP